eukprot:1012400_1
MISLLILLFTLFELSMTAELFHLNVGGETALRFEAVASAPIAGGGTLHKVLIKTVIGGWAPGGSTTAPSTADITIYSDQAEFIFGTDVSLSYVIEHSITNPPRLKLVPASKWWLWCHDGKEDPLNSLHSMKWGGTNAKKILQKYLTEDGHLRLMTQAENLVYTPPATSDAVRSMYGDYVDNQYRAVDVDEYEGDELMYENELINAAIDEEAAKLLRKRHLKKRLKHDFYY